MRPSALVNKVLLYCLAHAAEQHDVQIHAFCFMSNHFHLIVTDPSARLPEFMHLVDLYIAKSMNAELRRRENFWAPGSYSCVALQDEESILSEIVYVLMNPVAAGLVRFGSQWPGVRSRPEDVKGRRIVAERAGIYFSMLSSAPDVAEFEVVRPPIYESVSDEELAERIASEIEREEAEVASEVARQSGELLGRKGVLALSPFAAPATRRERLGKLNPRVAATHRWRRIAAIRRLKEFLREYREALKRYLALVRSDLSRASEVLFPAGTHLMRVRYAVRCHAPP